jgi:hypothetical protein
MTRHAQRGMAGIQRIISLFLPPLTMRLKDTPHG